MEFGDADFALNEFEWNQFMDWKRAFDVKRVPLDRKFVKLWSVIILEDAVVMFDLWDWENVMQNWDSQ